MGRRDPGCGQVAGSGSSARREAFLAAERGAAELRQGVPGGRGGLAAHGPPAQALVRIRPAEFPSATPPWRCHNSKHCRKMRLGSVEDEAKPKVIAAAFEI